MNYMLGIRHQAVLPDFGWSILTNLQLLRTNIRLQAGHSSPKEIQNADKWIENMQKACRRDIFSGAELALASRVLSDGSDNDLALAKMRSVTGSWYQN